MTKSFRSIKNELTFAFHYNWQRFNPYQNEDKQPCFLQSTVWIKGESKLPQYFEISKYTLIKYDTYKNFVFSFLRWIVLILWSLLQSGFFFLDFLFKDIWFYIRQKKLLAVNAIFNKARSVSTKIWQYNSWGIKLILD